MPRLAIAWFLAAAAVAPSVTHAQVMLAPPTTTPAAWERFALRVANANDTTIVTVTIRLPDGARLIGVDAPAGWTPRYRAATDSTAQAIEWSGSSIPRDHFREFPFLARIAPDLRSGDLVFPVRITRANGASVEWAAGGAGAPPAVRVNSITVVTPAAAFALAAFALGLAILAMTLALSGRRKGSERR
jgi:uncharacterized protein YcnI